MAQQAPPTERLTARQKAAMLLLSLDVETATRLMKQLTQEEVETLTVEISNVKGIPSNMLDHVTEEFHQMIRAQQYVVQGGLEYAERLLEASLGPERAAVVLAKVETLTQVTGFAALKNADLQQLASFLQKEHPQTVALILSNLGVDQAARVLSEFPPEVRNVVSHRMATLGKVSPALLKEVESVIEEIARTEIGQTMNAAGGTKSMAGVLNMCDAEAQREILEYIEQKDSNIASEIKKQMFIFDDLKGVDDRGIQRILREVDRRELALSLKVVDEELKEKIMKNMSDRAQDLLKEELQLMGPVRLKEVETAQTRILEIVKQLEEQGEVVIAGRGGKEDVVV
jgi:flagellar motor switch protein FliG